MDTPAVRERARARPSPALPANAVLLLPRVKPIGLQTYSMQLPAKNDVPPEVWFAAAIFESVVYPYHARGDGGGGDGGGGGGGSVRVEEMER